MPANAAIIGRVAVKVLPDTSDFRKDLQRKLDALERNITVELPTTVDMTGAKKDLLDGVRKLNAEVRGKDAYKVKLRTTLIGTTEEMRRQIKQINRQYQTISAVDPVKLDSILTAAELELHLDEENLKKVEEEIDHWRRKVSPIQVPVHTDVNAASQKGSAAKLGWLARARIVNLIPKVDSRAAAAAETMLAALSGSRLLSKTFKELREAFSNLDKNVPLIGSIALAIAGLSSWAMTGAANLFALSSSLAQIAGAGLALPGILGGMAVGLTVTIVAFRDINKIVPEVKKAWTQLRGTISDNFWAQAAAPIRDMTDRLLPHFVDGMAKASTAIGRYFGSLAHELTGAFDGPVAGMFRDLTRSVEIATGGTGALAGLITTLGRAGANQLPRLANWFVKVTNRMDDFFAKAERDGRLEGWINNGIEQLHHLGQVFKNLGGIFSGLSRAMENAGGSTLSMFAATLSKLNAVVNSPGFQTGMTETFHAAFQAMHAIATIAGPAVKAMFTALGKTLTTVLPTAGHAIGTLADALGRLIGSDAVQGGLKAMFTGLDKAIGALAPAIKDLAPVVGQLGQLFGTMAASFGPLLASSFRALIPPAVALMQAMEPMVRLLAGALTVAINTVAPLLRGLAPVIGALGAPLLAVAAGFKAAAIAAALFGKQGKITLLATGIKTATLAIVSNLRLMVAGFRDARVAQSAFSGAAGSFGGMIRTYGKGLGVIGAVTLAAYGLGKALSHVIDGNKVSQKIGSWAGNMRDFRDAIVSANGALDQNTRLMIGKKLQDSGMAERAAAAGISLRQLTDAVTGSDSASRALIETWKAQGKPSEDTIAALMSLHIQYREASAAARELTVATSTQATGAKAAGVVNNQLRTSLQNVYEQQVPAAVSKSMSLKQSVDAMSGSMQQAALSGKALADAIKKIDGGAISAAQAQIAFRNAVNTAADGIRQNGNALLGNSKAALTNRGAILDALEAAKAHANAMIDQGKSAASVKKALSDDVGMLIEHAKKAGVSEGALRRLVGSMGLLPGQIQKSLGATRTVGQKAGADTAEAVGKAINSKTPEIKRAGEAAGRAADEGVTKGINDNIKNVSSVMTKVADTVRNSTSNWSGLLYNAGSLIMDGLIAGIESKRGALQSKLHDVTADVPKHKGPKPVDKKLLYQSGRWIMEGLIKGIGSRMTDLRSKLGTMTTEIGRITDKGLRKSLGNKVNRLKLDLIDWQANDDAIQKAKDSLRSLADEAKAYHDQIMSSLIAEGDITKSKAGTEGGKTTFDQIKSDLAAAVVRAEHFAQVLAKLKKLGLNQTALDQLASAGAENGTGAADALLSAGKAGIDAINKLDKRLAAAANAAANTARNAMYEAGIQSAKGLVDGLKKDQKKLEAAMRHLATVIVDTIKKKLDIHSPSRVMHKLGQFTGKGLLKGLESTYSSVRRSFGRFADDLAGTDFGSPTVQLGATVSQIARKSLANGDTTSTGGDTKVLNYYAAPGNSLSSEDDLHAAVRRSRFAW